MAGMDYIWCRRCGTRVLYDGEWNGRERLIENWNTVELLCPPCIDKYEHALDKALECLRTGKVRLAKKILGNYKKVDE
jgi:hypothetical protein